MMFCIKDMEGRLIECNSALANFLGYDETFIRGKHFAHVIKNHCNKYWSDDLRVFNEDQPLLGIIEPFKREGKETQLIRTDKYPLKNDHGEVYAIIIYSQEITSFVKMQNQQFEELNKRKLKMVQMINDLRVPLSGLPQVANALEQVNPNQLGPENLNFLITALNNTKITYRLVNSLLENYNHSLLAGNTEVRFNLFHMVIDCTALLAEISSQHLVTIIMENVDDSGVLLKGNVLKIRAALLQLIRFAIDKFPSAQLKFKIMSNTLEIIIKKCQHLIGVTDIKEFNHFLAIKAAITELGGTLTSYSTPASSIYGCIVTLPVQ
jgi:hypothetical protein